VVLLHGVVGWLKLMLARGGLEFGQGRSQPRRQASRYTYRSRDWVPLSHVTDIAHMRSHVKSWHEPLHMD
jgi:hypothetical protein